MGARCRAQSPCVRRARERIVGAVFEFISRWFGASPGAPVAAGLATVLRMPGAVVIDLRPAGESVGDGSVFAKVRAALTPEPIQVWVLSPALVAHWTPTQIIAVSSGLFDCEVGAQQRFVVFDGADANPAVVYLLRSSGLEVMGPDCALTLTNGARPVRVLDLFGA